MSPAVNKHVRGGWSQQNGSVYEIIFSLNERPNELLSLVDPVLAPVFNISWAIFFSMNGIERLSHTLSGTWKCLCFTGVCWQRQQRRWHSQVCVCVFVCVSATTARLHHCGWPITLESQRAVEVSCWQLKREKGFCFHCVSPEIGHRLQDQVFAPATLLLRNWKQEMKENARHWRCLDSKSSGFLSARCVFIHSCFAVKKIGSEAAYAIKDNKSFSCYCCCK